MVQHKMKATLLILAFTLSCSTLAAESYRTIGSTLIKNQDGKTTTLKWIGNRAFGFDGTAYSKIGNTTFKNSDSKTTTYNKIGNSTFGVDGSTLNTVGNSTFTKDSNGNPKACNKISNSTF